MNRKAPDVTSHPLLAGTHYEGWAQDDVTRVNAHFRVRTCPAHSEPLRAHYANDRWECPHGDVVMRLDEGDLPHAAFKHGIVLSDHDPVFRGTSLDRVGPVNVLGVRFPQFALLTSTQYLALLVLAIVNALAAFGLDHLLGHPIDLPWSLGFLVAPGLILTAGVCAIVHRRRVRNTGIGLKRAPMPPGFRRDAALPSHELSDDDLVGVPGTSTILRRRWLRESPIGRNIGGPTYSIPTLRDLLLAHCDATEGTNRESRRGYVTP